MRIQIDISENKILERYPEVLNILLQDQTTQTNIIWATSNYEHLGEYYLESNPIELEHITGANDNIIMPRVQKHAVLQQSRAKNMAEVFTPSWICNVQNNLIDNAWFERKNVFNKESPDKRKWKTNKDKIVFPKNKTWLDYVKSNRLEITCGEAPYITSRYDTTTGNFIEVEDRIGLLDRKLRVINENVHNNNNWLDASQIAYKSTYAYEWQGDSLLLARESMLYAFIENYKFKFNEEPALKSIQDIAFIISWNVWQMDGLKGVVPNSCEDKIVEVSDFFETKSEISKCRGCEKQQIKHHNGIYCNIMDWEIEKPIRFIDLLKN